MKFRPLTSSTFRAQLSLFAGMLLLPLAGLMGWQVYSEFQEYLESARQSSLTLARLAAAHIDEIVRDLDGTLRVIANRPQIQALDAARCDPMLREMPTILQPYANLALAKRDGTVICSAIPPPDNQPMSLAKMPWFADARDVPGLHVSDPFMGPYTGRLVMAFSYPIRDRERTIVGRVGLSVDVARFQSVLDSLTLPPDTVLALLSADGTLLARVPALPAQIGTRASNAEIVQQTSSAPEGVAQSRGADGSQRIYGFTREPRTGWLVYASLPLEVALAPASRGALEAVLVFFAETALLALFVGLLYRWMGRSVRVLGAAADVVYGGGRALQLPPIAPLELRQTADAFNSMLLARARAEDLAHGQKRVLEMIATGAPLEQTLAELARIAEAQNPEMICTVLLLDADGQRLRHGAAPSLPEEYTSAIDGAAVAEGAGSCGTAAHRRQRVIVADIATDPLWADYRELALKHGLRSCWSTPIFDAQHQVLGTFAIYGRQPGRPTDEDLFLIETVTQSAAIAITSHHEKAALHLSNERYQLAGRATNDVVWDWDLITGQLWWNRNFQTLFGYAPEQIEPGLESWTQRLHPHDEARVKEGIYKVIDGGGTSWTDEYRFRRSDGSYAEILDRGYAIRDDAGKAVRMIGAMMDITERKAQQLRIVKLSRTYSVLSAISNLIVRARSRAELLQEACRVAVEQGLFPAAWIGLREGDEVRPVALHGDDGGYVKDVVISLRAGGVNSSGPAARALRTGHAAIVNDIDSEPTLARWHAALRAMGYYSYVAYPLLVAGEVVGCLCLYAREPNFFDEAEVKLLGELASDISYAMEFITREETLDNLAIYDPLTRLPNRTLFVQRLEQFVRLAQESRSALAVLMLDVDRFKSLNDLVGRAGGDELLKKIGERLKRIAGGSKYIARVAGDRFAMVIPRPENAATLAATLKDSNWALLQTPYQIGEHELKVSLKLGIALLPDHGDDAESLLRNSEAALKHARSSGQRQVMYTRDMGVAVAERLKKEDQMRRALEREEFVLHYQPKVDLRSGAICGAEALIRWNSPDRGLVGPDEFISLVEATGQIQDIGRWALQRAVKDSCSWASQGAPAPRVAVNVSQAQLLQPDYVDTLKSVLAEAQSTDMKLELEITESMLMTEIRSSIEKLRMLRELGVAIVMDDFGTGYSSLIALTQLPLSAIKIDRSFVADMLDNPGTRTIVSTIIALAHSMKLIVIAEGVETVDQLALLRQLGCDEMQGWLFSRALPADEYLQLLRSGRKLPHGLMPA